jgi:hypothetical protein
MRSRAQEKFERVLFGIAFLVLLVGVILPWARASIVGPESSTESSAPPHTLTEEQRQDLRSLADEFDLTESQRATARQWVREYEATGKTPVSLDDAASKMNLTEEQKDQAYQLVKEAGD